MRPEFICVNHREWLESRPIEAYNWWERSFDAGKNCQELHQWRESVRPLGCAFDAATICMKQAQIIESDAIEFFYRTVQCLTYSLLKMGQQNFAQQIVESIDVLLKGLSERVFDRQKMLDMQRKLHLFLAANLLEKAGKLSDRSSNIPPHFLSQSAASIH